MNGDLDAEVYRLATKVHANENHVEALRAELRAERDLIKESFRDVGSSIYDIQLRGNEILEAVRAIAASIEELKAQVTKQQTKKRVKRKKGK